MGRIYVDKYTARLERSDIYYVNLILKDGTVIENLEPRRLFPFSNKNMYITLLDAEEKEVALIRDFDEVDEASRKVLSDCFEDYYLIPEITRVCDVIVKNGTMNRISGTFPLVCVNYGEATTNNVYCDFTFEGVEFTSTSGSRFILDTWENGYSKATATVTTDVTFRDCTFNVKDSIEGTVFLPLNNVSSGNETGKDRSIYNVKIYGGSIIASSAITMAAARILSRMVFLRADMASGSTSISLVRYSTVGSVGASSSAISTA